MGAGSMRRQFVTPRPFQQNPLAESARCKKKKPAGVGPAGNQLGKLLPKKPGVGVGIGGSECQGGDVEPFWVAH